MANLQLAVKGEYFDAMIRGEKTEEYRLCNDYWNIAFASQTALRRLSL